MFNIVSPYLAWNPDSSCQQLNVINSHEIDSSLSCSQISGALELLWEYIKHEKKNPKKQKPEKTRTELESLL